MRIGPVWLVLCLCLCAATDPLTLSCSPDFPVVEADASVMVRAFVSEGTPHYAWIVTAGSIAGTGSEARWNLSGVPAGTKRGGRP